MSEASVMVPNENLLLEALFDQGNGIDVAVISHPHPLYGGSMDNSVVSVLQKTLHDCGWGPCVSIFAGSEEAPVTMEAHNTMQKICWLSSNTSPSKARRPFISPATLTGRGLA